MVNEHTIMTTLFLQNQLHRYTLSYFYGLLGVFLSRILLEFFFKLVYPTSCIPPWLRKSFKFIMLRLLKDTFVRQKIESVHFCSCPQAKHSTRQKEITHFIQAAFSKNLFFTQEKGGTIMELKLNLQRYWSQVFINSTILAIFRFLVSVLLCHNLDSSRLKCEGSLT